MMSVQETPLLTAENLSCSFAGKVLFQNLNLQLCARDLILIKGANGTGKSTLLRCLVGDVKADSGKVTRGAKLNEILFFPQLHAPLFHIPVTLKEVAEMGSLVSLEKARATVQSLTELFPESLHFKLWNTASGGEKTRALLSRIFLQNPRILLLDEPFNHLDKTTINVLQHALIEYLEKNSQAGCLLISHVQEEWPPSRNIAFSSLSF